MYFSFHFQSFFAERFFTLFDSDGGGTIDLNEMMEGLIMLTKGTQEEKLKFLFNVYDVDGNIIIIKKIIRGLHGGGDGGGGSGPC